MPSLLGTPALRASAPAARVSPNIAIDLKKIDEKPGVKGTLPLGCLPLWGREGVTLIVAGKK
jgi:hypothetical protein